MLNRAALLITYCVAAYASSGAARNLLPSLHLFVSCFCLLAAASARGGEVLVAPIEVKPSAYVQRDYNRQQAAWERHLLVDGFHAHGRTDEGSHNGGDHWHTCEVWQNGSEPMVTASLLDKFYLSDAPQTKVTLEAVNTFVVQCWEGRVSYYVNGQEILKDDAPVYDGVVHRDEVGPQIGFGANRFGAKHVTRIRDIEVRQLTAAPTETVK